MFQADEPIQGPETNTPDTEGHSLSGAEFDTGLARERGRDAERYAQEQARSARPRNRTAACATA